MGLRDEYDMEQVDVEDTEAYREAARAGVTGMGLDEALGLWRDTAPETDVEEAYAAALGHTSTLQYDAEALYTVCDDMELAGRDGLFISAAIDKAPADAVELPDLSGVDYVGYRGIKDVTVDGGVGDWCGEELMDGTLRVTADAGKWAGRAMYGGTLIVGGDADVYCGHSMEDGRITVEGDVRGSGRAGEGMEGGRITIRGHGGGRVGQDMKGGLIHVEGDAGAHVGCSMEDGRVRVEGEVDHNLGRAMNGGTVEVGSTAHTVGRLSSGGDIVIDRPHPDAGGLAGPGWPSPPGDPQGARIFYGTGSSQRQAWPPQSIADWGEHAARALGEALDDWLNGV